MTYYVKGRSANRHGLVAEVVCAQLAHALGLPVPEAAIADVSEELVQATRAAGLPLDELGAGPAFASRVEPAVEFTMAHRPLVDRELAQMLSVFDWRVRNEDRTLSALGGNANLLWRIHEPQGLVVIDHNLAFTDFEARRFLETHVFADDFRTVASDFELRASWSERLGAVLRTWDTYYEAIPQEWAFIDPEQTVPSNVDKDALREMLASCTPPDFWSLS